MGGRYYLDTCIWRDYFENRSDRLRPLGEWALSLIKRIIAESGTIVYSDLVEEELAEAFGKAQSTQILSVVPTTLLEHVSSTPLQLEGAVRLRKTKGIPTKDALHAILARDSRAILITRDKHFLEAESVVEVRKPEDLI